MRIQLLRHATLLLCVNNLKLLIDPMLSPKGSMAPVKNSGNNNCNPLDELPMNNNELVSLLNSIDALLLTHTHRDHFDDTAARLIPKNIPVFCQPEDITKLIDLGFSQVTPINDFLIWEGIRFTRTDGQHGTGLTKKLMGSVSGYIIESQNKSLYITGDTIWCSDVEKALETFHPNTIIAFAGAAKFLTGGPITMTADDICKVCRKAPRTKIIVVHMESFNHCSLPRKELKSMLNKENLISQVYIPENGEWLELS